MANHTDDGVLHHGTPEIEFALGCFAQGLFISSDNQGRAVWGRGTYTNKLLSLARSYAGGRGVVLDLPVVRDSRLRILDWSRVADSPAIEALMTQCEERGEDRFWCKLVITVWISLLTSTFCCRIFALLTSPNPMRMLVQAYRSAIFDTSQSPVTRIQAYQLYVRLYGLALSMENIDVPLPPKLDDLLAELSNRKLREEALAKDANEFQNAVNGAWQKFSAEESREKRELIWEEFTSQYHVFKSFRRAPKCPRLTFFSCLR